MIGFAIRQVDVIFLDFARQWADSAQERLPPQIRFFVSVGTPTNAELLSGTRAAGAGNGNRSML